MNGYTEAWCLSFNQHLGRSLLVPADVSRRPGRQTTVHFEEMHRGIPPLVVNTNGFFMVLDFDLLCKSLSSMVKLLLLSDYTRWVSLWHETYV